MLDEVSVTFQYRDDFFFWGGIQPEQDALDPNDFTHHLGGYLRSIWICVARLEANFQPIIYTMRVAKSLPANDF